MRRLILTVSLILVLAAPAWAGFLEGVAAYERGDYAMALREFRPLAEQGYAGAQNNLGLMYARGRGVPQDYAAAVKWYRKAAEQGYVEAQHNLGSVPPCPRRLGAPTQLARRAANSWREVASCAYPTLT